VSSSSAPSPGLASTRSALPLSRANLRALPPQVAVPVYQSGALTPGILHVGVGNFHRAHQAV
jgi:hypothetical protein